MGCRGNSLKMTVFPQRNLVKLKAATLFLANRHLHYVQGQSPKPNVREYFYYIDHQGQLFLDDARMKNFTSCFKEKVFLEFFFKRLKLNDTGRHMAEFPYFSPCGRERNYVRCDDLPVVFTQILEAEQEGLPEMFSYCWAEDLLTVKFQPEKICMLPETGRVYHPAPDRTAGVGLIRSGLAIELSKNFQFGNQGEYSPPTHFTWKGVRYTLTNEMVPLLKHEEERKSTAKTSHDI